MCACVCVQMCVHVHVCDREEEEESEPLMHYLLSKCVLVSAYKLGFITYNPCSKKPVLNMDSISICKKLSYISWTVSPSVIPFLTLLRLFVVGLWHRLYGQRRIIILP